MKKIYSFIIMALMLCVGFASCSHEETTCLVSLLHSA